jgi:hypothetical protein
MGYFQLGADLPVWWGAYEKGLKDFQGNEAKAVDYADSIVRMSQASGQVQDLARIQRGSELGRLATLFYTFFNTMYNVGARRIDALANDRSPSSILAAANTALVVWFFPAVFNELLAGRGPDPDDDDDDPMAWAFRKIAVYPFMGIVGVRDLASAVESGFGYQISPAQSAPASAYNWLRQVQKALDEEQELDAGKMVEASVRAAGYAAKLPLEQTIITVRNLWNYLTGDDPDFYVRDLFFNKPKSRKEN